MSKFRKGNKKKVAAITTASLPDIIFMLLFFFMVTTVMREVDVKVTLRVPTASEVTKLEDKALVSYIYIGRPLGTSTDALPEIQLNDAFASPDLIKDFIVGKRELIKEQNRNKMTVSLKIDTGTKMGVVADVKTKLRQASAYKVNYSTYEGSAVEDN
jgi:biopolymer transport protein ExbD